MQNEKAALAASKTALAVCRKNKQQGLLTMGNNQDLLPCPFCGNDPDIVEDVADTYYIACRNDDCKVLVEVWSSGGMLEIIKIWNDRVKIH